MEDVHLGKIVGHVSRPRSNSVLCCQGSLGVTRTEDADWRKGGNALNITRVSTISLYGCGASGAYALSPHTKEEEEEGGSELVYVTNVFSSSVLSIQLDKDLSC